MATIPYSGLRHVRKTITFDGGAGSGAVGTVTVFTSTGDYELSRLYGKCTTTLEDTVDGAEFKVGFEAEPGILFDGTLATGGELDLDDVVAGKYLLPDGIVGDMGGPLGGSDQLAGHYASDEDIIITVSGQAITAGVLVFDAWFTPITDDGALAGDDIDEPDTTAFADALLARDFASVVGAAARSPLNALRFLRNHWAAAGGTLTVYEENDTTPAWTSAVTSAPADPIVESDPT